MLTTYTVAFPEPWTHLFHVTAHFTGLPAEPTVRFALPAWTPGSYKVRDYARHVQDFEALRAGRDLAPLAVEKVDKSTWRVATAGADEVLLRYRVYANELTVRTAHLDDRHAYWNAAALHFYLDAPGGLARPARVEVEPPLKAWRAATALEPAPGEDPAAPLAFVAPGYDALVDAPFDVSPHHRRVAFEAAGVPHEVVICGHGNFDLARISEDIPRIVEAEAALMGGLPASLSRYVFIVNLVPEGQPGGGLEHCASCSLQWQRFRFRPREKYEDFLALVSHEYFHLWNGKRIRPRELGPFDYGRENYTRALWVVEGVTSYYDELFLVRAGLIDAEAYLRRLGDHLQGVLDTPGRRHHSLEEASFDAWIKHYQRTEHSVNATVSYYEKGQIAAWLLDLEIRRASGWLRSLDDVLRALWREHEASGGAAYDLARFEAIAAEVAGADLTAFFDAVARGVGDAEPGRALEPLGLRLVEEPKKDGAAASAAADKDGGERAWLGARLKTDAGKTVVTEVLEASPAWRAGLMAMDELLALDGFRVTADSLEARLGERTPGDRVRIAVFRGDELREVEAELGGKKPTKLAIRPAERVSDVERARLEAWLGRPLRDARREEPAAPAPASPVASAPAAAGGGR